MIIYCLNCIRLIEVRGIIHKIGLKAVFQLRVFYTYVLARKSLNHFNITFEVNKCIDGENSAFSTI